MTNETEANAELRRIESDMTRARDRLQDMEMEARGLAEATRKHLGGKIRTYKDSLAAVSNDLRRAKDKFSRSALMTGGTAAGAARPLDFDKSADSRARMASTTDKLRGGTSMLEASHQRLEETIGVGEGIMTELQRNRETMVRVRGNVGEINGVMDQARVILRSMARREVRTKLMLGCFVFVVLSIIIGMIVWIVKAKQAQSEPAPAPAPEPSPSPYPFPPMLRRL